MSKMGADGRIETGVGIPLAVQRSAEATIVT
jgi:hypothetical protein